ncbi:hypothetical protein SBRCBS47491_002075 [Sporothrix bragantina]|uniref:FAD-binding domain-containing protein n=1 Tax=Sporothrix bragantina TaxID=671064 RepID=A0ABP0B3W7_9PEZI
MATQDRAQGRPLRIAIIGAGLVGTATYIALSRLPNVQITVYERAPGPHETGAWIAMTVSGLRVLGRMLPQATYQQIRDIMFQGKVGIEHHHWQTGEVMAVAASPHMDAQFREGRTHRIPLHNILVSQVPAEKLHYSKEVKAVAVKKDATGRSLVRLSFTDGSPDVEADLVVAADGIHSKIRKQYLPDSLPTYRGAVAYRHIFSESLVQHISDLPAESGSWQNNYGEIAYMSRVGLGKYGFVAIVREDEKTAAPLRWGHSLGQAGIDRLKQHFADWDPLVRKVVDALPGIDGYRLETAPWMAELTRNGHIAFVGDAAHPTAGAYGGGATFGYCDAWALYRSLSSPAARGNIARALQLYNRIRRPFLARVEMQLDLDKLNGAYVAEAKPATSPEWSRRWLERYSPHAWMLEYDVEAECQRVESEVVNMAHL